MMMSSVRLPSTGSRCGARAGLCGRRRQSARHPPLDLLPLEGRPRRGRRPETLELVIESLAGGLNGVTGALDDHAPAADAVGDRVADLLVDRMVTARDDEFGEARAAQVVERDDGPSPLKEAAQERLGIARPLLPVLEDPRDHAPHVGIIRHHPEGGRLYDGERAHVLWHARSLTVIEPPAFGVVPDD